MISFNEFGNLGRLGNQMFQYAALRGIASKYNYEYCLPPRDYVGTIDPNVKFSDTTIFETFKLPNCERLITNYPTHYEQTQYQLDNFFWNECVDDINFHGFFQTEKYFKHVENEIRDSFVFFDQILEPSKKQFELMFGNDDVISLHFRRTDYLKYSDVYKVHGIEYAKKALRNFDDHIPVIIFSDDVDWCKEQDYFKSSRFIISENNSTSVDLCLQSLCSHHILSNSTFSWWGSWLAKSKKTVAPKNWFAETHESKYVGDLYLLDWIVI